MVSKIRNSCHCLNHGTSHFTELWAKWMTKKTHKAQSRLAQTEREPSLQWWFWGPVELSAAAELQQESSSLRLNAAFSERITQHVQVFLDR